MGIFSIFSGGKTKKAANNAATALQNASAGANTQLDIGFDEANNQTNKATGIFQQIGDSYAKGAGLYQDAIGVNGQAGADSARSAFQTGPGYAFNLDQGMQALQRMRAVNGTLASGNADTDAMKFASGQADQAWNGWLDRLQGLDANRANARAQEASTFSDLARYAIGRGTAKAGLTMDTSRGVSDYQLQGAKAADQGAAMGLGALFGVGNLVAGGLGTLAGNPAALTNITKAFSGYGAK